MFRTAELGRKLSKEEFDRVTPTLRAELVELQQTLRQSGEAVVVLFAGVDGAGKGDTVNLLNSWMDPRWIATHAYGPRSDEERERPEFWRFWRDLPGRGRVGLFLSAWYSRPLVDHAYAVSDDAALDRALERIASFERTLTDDGTLILKFWMHLGRDAQRQRLEALAADPLKSWQVTDTDWEHWHLYDRFVAAAERLIMRTSTGHAPWRIVEGEDHRYRTVAVVTELRAALRAHLAARAAAGAAAPSQSSAGKSGKAEKAKKAARGAAAASGREGGAEVVPRPSGSVLAALDMSRTVRKDAYPAELARAQGRLNTLYRAATARQVSTVVVLEGWDAAGKGGAIRHMTAALDARGFQVIPIAAPSDEERAQNYLWRFWRQLSRAGRVTIYDRSWYGRVLVERVEGFAAPNEWRRAFAEINDFEQQLIEFGMVLVKLWVHVTEDEQLHRFKRRQRIPYKRWKLTDEDWRNRERWCEYEEAVQEMVARTSTSRAPWTLVEGNCKRWARLKVLATVADALEQRLGAAASGADEQRAGEVASLEVARAGGRKRGQS